MKITEAISGLAQTREYIVLMERNSSISPGSKESDWVLLGLFWKTAIRIYGSEQITEFGDIQSKTCRPSQKKTDCWITLSSLLLKTKKENCGLAPEEMVSVSSMEKRFRVSIGLVASRAHRFCPWSKTAEEIYG